ncbi:MAG: cell division protein FtsQ/DivIB [Clostridia bacterium]|nr:FtsQ-type POTRA domain-containing protein [Clostridium sp.]
MPKKPKEENIDLYRFNNGQDQNIENLMERKKEREKRIKERNNIQKEENEFDFDTETVIGMTNKNNKKKQDEMKKEFAKKQRKRDKRLKRIKFFLKLILLIGVISGIIAFATCSPIFNIQNIEVINNKQLSPETIISLSELSIGQNIFKFWENDVENKIKSNAYIESVELKRVFPNKLQINIQEREPKFSVPVLGEYAYINTQGYILEITQNQLNLPIITGISTKEEEIKPGNRLNNKDLTELEIILKIISAMKENQLDKEVTSIDISNKNDYIIYMQNEKKKIHLGDGSNLSNKMLYVIAIINEEKGKEGEIFANGDLNQKFKVYFREKV